MKISRMYSKLEKVVIELDKREILEAVTEYINKYFNGVPKGAKWTMTWEVGDLVDELVIEATYNIEEQLSKDTSTLEHK